MMSSLNVKSDKRDKRDRSDQDRHDRKKSYFEKPAEARYHTSHVFLLRALNVQCSVFSIGTATFDCVGWTLGKLPYLYTNQL